MRLPSWLKPMLDRLAAALSAYRVNPRALVFAVACWLVWSGWSHWSPPGARVVTGLILLHAVHRQSRPAIPTPPAK